MSRKDAVDGIKAEDVKVAILKPPSGLFKVSSSAIARSSIVLASAAVPSAAIASYARNSCTAAAIAAKPTLVFIHCSICYETFFWSTAMLRGSKSKVTMLWFGNAVTMSASRHGGGFTALVMGLCRDAVSIPRPRPPAVQCRRLVVRALLP
jgi:hypothetical protein